MYQTLEVIEKEFTKIITFNRLSAKNSLNNLVIEELKSALEDAEQSANNRIIILQGQSGIFCTGMDLEAVINNEKEKMDSQKYMQLLKYLTTIPRIIISNIEGVVVGGGIGIVAASDLTIAHSNSKFSLSEALWGLLPCCVAPYLIKRVGFQAAYRLTLTTQPIEAEEAHRIQLIDNVSDCAEATIQKLCLRLKRLHPQTIQDMKLYFGKLIDISEQIEHLAINEINRLIKTPLVKENIANYINNQKFPGE